MVAETAFWPVPAGLPDRRPGHSLPLRYLLAAVALHGAVLALWPRPIATFTNTLPSLEIFLRERLPVPATTVETRPSPLTIPAAGSTRTAAGAQAPRSEGDSQVASPNPASTVAGDTPLAEAARTSARLEAARLARDPMAPPPTAREAASPLTRAATRADAGERLLQDGLVQITNPDGSRYCLLRPPAVANLDGPVPVLSIPMNCP